MKRGFVIKLVIGGILVVGGLGNLTTEIGAALIGLLGGATLIGWAFVTRSGCEIADTRTESSAVPLHSKEYQVTLDTTIRPENISHDLRERINKDFHISVDIAAPKNPDGITFYRATTHEISTMRDYYVLDVETTGLDRNTDKIVELAWLQVSGGEILNRFSTLVNPEMPIPPEASDINGICDADVKQAPTYSQITDTVSMELLDQIVVGHNVQFDLAFIKNLINAKDHRIVYVDTLALAKKVFPGLKSYALDALCAELSLPVNSSHRASQDAEATKALLDACLSKMREQKEFEKRQMKEKRECEKSMRFAKFNKSPLFDISFVYTGGFTIPRSEMESLAVSVGAIPRAKVTSKTDYLVVGDVSELPQWALDRKLGKANEFIEKHGKIQKISEGEYIKMIGAAKACLGATQSQYQESGKDG